MQRVVYLSTMQLTTKDTTMTTLTATGERFELTASIRDAAQIGEMLRDMKAECEATSTTTWEFDSEQKLLDATERLDQWGGLEFETEEL